MNLTTKKSWIWWSLANLTTKYPSSLSGYDIKRRLNYQSFQSALMIQQQQQRPSPGGWSCTVYNLATICRFPPKSAPERGQTSMNCNAISYKSFLVSWQIIHLWTHKKAIVFVPKHTCIVHNLILASRSWQVKKGYVQYQTFALCHLLIQSHEQTAWDY